MPILLELRLVAIVWPESSWGEQINPDDTPFISPRGVECSTFTLCEVGPVRGEPDKRGCWKTVNLFLRTMQQWEDVRQALEKPVLYAEDFGYLSTALLQRP